MVFKEKLKKRIQKLEKEAFTICQKLCEKKIVLCPAGRFFRITIKELEDFGIYVDLVADKVPSQSKGKKEWEYNGSKYKAEQIDDVIKKYGNECNYIICSRSFYKEIKNNLMESGIREENVFTAPVYMGGLVPKKVFQRRLEVWNAWSDISNALNNLETEESKETLLNILAIFCCSTPVWQNTGCTEEYFNIGYFSLEDNEVFIDAGMYDGKTTERFIELCQTYKAVYGIEANPKQMDIIRENLKKYENIYLFNNALSNTNCSLKFSDGGEGARLSQNGLITVNGLCGDSMNVEPTYIKMDIEGAEYDALLGFKDTIRKYKPKLAIAIYHGLSDHWRLINLIRELCPEYKINCVHHYGYEILFGTVIYASVDKRADNF